MAFLDNSGDILLDAVLTDEGRKRLAAGTFRPVKYAFGDPEVNYLLYDKTNPSGSAYFDLEILKLPVEIAHTNAAISLRTKLFTLASQNGDPSLLYLPEIKLDTISFTQLGFASGRNAYALVADKETYDQLTSDAANALPAGFMDARSADLAVNSLRIRTPIGIDNAAAGDPIDETLDPSLDETQYSVVVDDRLVKLVSPPSADLASAGALQASVTFGTVGTAAGIAQAAARSNVFSGDDNLRVYDVSTSNNSSQFVPKSSIAVTAGPSTDNVLATSYVVNQQNQNYMFTTYKLGNVTNYAGTGIQMEVIQSSVRVIGSTTGYSLTVPIEIIRKV